MIFLPNSRITCLLLIGFIGACHGQKFSKGTCPALNSFTTATLTLTSLVNTWREVARTPTIYRHDWRCVTYTFTAITASVQYTVSIAGVKKLGSAVTAAGTVDVVGATATATAAGTFFTFKINYGGKEITSNYYIVRTFDQNYIVLYACENFLLGKIESAIVLARAGTPEINIRAALNSLSQYGVQRDELIYSFTNQCL